MGEPIKIYGGPAHGQVREDNGLPRFEMMVQQLSMNHYFCDTGQFLHPPRNLFETRSYYVQKYGEYASRPDRRRQTRVAILEGVELTQREQWDLEADLRKKPWCVCGASILSDFEQWFAGAVYRHTGELWWMGQRVRR